MLHKQEQRIYRIFLATLPLVLVALVLSLPSLQRPPAVNILITDSIPDYLYKENETIRLTYASDDLDRDLLVASWKFGDSILVWRETAPDTCNPPIEVRVDWESGSEDSLEHRFGLRYDTLSPRKAFGWAESWMVLDSVARVRFPKAGRYKLRLTLVSPFRRKPFIEEREIEIVPVAKRSEMDSVVRIIGPTAGLVGEELVFCATGPEANFWYWEFADTMDQNQLRPQVTHTFYSQGKKTIKLRTDLSDNWIEYTVEISPIWNVDSIQVEEPDTGGALTGRYKLDLRRKIQDISNTMTSDTRRFYEIKSQIERYYLSERFKPVDVWINEDKEPVDFDSYCQRIHFLEGQLIIDEVSFEWDGDSTSRRIRSLLIRQRHVGNSDSKK